MKTTISILVSIIILLSSLGGKAQDYLDTYTIAEIPINFISDLAKLPVDQVPVGTPVHDPGAKYLMKLKAIEDKRAYANQLIRQTETVQRTIQILQTAREQKEEIQTIYNLQRDIRNDLKKLKAIKDMTIHDVAYFAETIIGESLNPADYMIDMDEDWGKDFKRAIQYRPSTKVSSDSKSIVRFLTRYREGDTLTIRRFDQIAEVIGVSAGWRNYMEEEELRNALVKKRTNEMLENKIKELMEMTLTIDSLSMSDGERATLLLELYSKLSDVNDNIYEAGKVIENKSKEEIKKMAINVAIMNQEIAEQRIFRAIVHSEYKKNKGFRMASYKHGESQMPKLNPVRLR
jgi:hypothetical protein